MWHLNLFSRTRVNHQSSLVNIEPAHDKTYDKTFAFSTVWSESSLISCALYSRHGLSRGINENPCHTGWVYRLIWVFAGHTGLFVGFVVRLLIYLSETLCPADTRRLYNVDAAGLGGSVGCAIRLETRRSRVQPPPRSATFFRGDWSWNIFYGHSLPSADSRRAVVSFWRKNVHNTG